MHSVRVAACSCCSVLAERACGAACWRGSFRAEQHARGATCSRGDQQDEQEEGDDADNVETGDWSEVPLSCSA